MNHIVEVLIVIGLVGALITIIKYPKDSGKTVLGFLFFPFRRLWNLLLVFLIPIGLLVLIVESKLEINFLSKYINKLVGRHNYKTQGRKNLNFKIFSNYILVNTISAEIEAQLKEAEGTCHEVNNLDYQVYRTDKYSIIELPNISFYGFNYMIQWLASFLKNTEVYGFSDSGRSQFITYVDKKDENDLIGLTNTGKKFFVSLYDDLNKQQYLRLNQSIEVDTTYTTVSMKQLVIQAIKNTSGAHFK